MKDHIIHIEKLNDPNQPPYELLELADPSFDQINQYLKLGSCYIAKQQKEVIGVIVLVPIDTISIEIKNIAIKESVQGKGFGKLLLRFVEKISRASNHKKILIGTGNSSIGQLALYQKEGFEIVRIKRNFFLENYNEPIFENGIQCKHMIMLEKNLA